LRLEEPIRLDNGQYIRPDVVDYKNNIIYDYKFGFPNRTPEQLNMSFQMQRYRIVLQMPSEVIKPKPVHDLNTPFLNIVFQIKNRTSHLIITEDKNKWEIKLIQEIKLWRIGMNSSPCSHHTHQYH